ncbi:MAG: tol-pal system protein YbgF [Zoogloeaceae bacterium]|jgi:tol-pal system protein YbgF|nr:tol-pal system protein YbgF [Zoogloeaceae bacterium]
MRGASRLFSWTLPVTLAVTLLIAPASRAGLFDDSEARQQIAGLKQESDQRYDSLSKALLELQTRILGQAEELARLRGQMETLAHENAQAKQRQQDFYRDLDLRLLRLEGVATTTQEGTAADPRTEANAYEKALALFKAGKYADATDAFASFVDNYPESEMAPNAMFWLGNSFYARNDCKEAITAQETVLSRWPDSARVPDALLAIADCQRDRGNDNAARATLNALIAQHGRSQAAVKARERLSQLR